MNLHKLNLKHKLFLIIIVVSITLTLFTVINFSYTLTQYNKLLYRQTANSLSFFSDELNYKLQEITNTSSYIAYDSEFQRNLDIFNSTPYSSLHSQNARASITDLCNHYYSPDLTHITVVTAEGDSAVWWGSSKLDEPEEIMNDLYKKCDEQQGRLVWMPSQTSKSLICARRILKAQNLSLKPLGYLLIGVDLDHLIHPLMSTKYTDGNSFQIYLSTDETLFYSSDPEFASAQDQQYFSFDGPYSIQGINGQRMFITKTTLALGRSSWHLSLAVAYGDVFRSLNMILPVFLLSLFLAIMISVLLAGSIVKRITQQFHILAGKMSLVRQEGIMKTLPAAPAAKDTHDEMTMLNIYFDQMIVELKKLIEENYVKQLLITQAELKALEQQVNPHFLYNTLNTVNWLAKKAGEKDISTIAESLGNLLQNTLRVKETTVPLNTELEIVSSYLKIQQIRFEDLVFTAAIDPGLENVTIPKMTLQPLIENALIHSQEEPQLEYRITLTIEKLEDTAKLRVANSGSEIDVHILEHLRDQTVKPKGNGIGLLNIDSRLRILFGDACGLHFENTNGMAAVWFMVPLSSGTETCQP